MLGAVKAVSVFQLLHLEKATIAKHVFAFSKEFRIRKRSEFVRLQRGKRRLNTRHFIIFLSHSPTLSSRLGVVVSKRVDKRAVKRNLIKRRLREVFRLERPRFDKAYNIVIISKTNALEIGFAETKHELQNAFSKARLFNTELTS